MNPFYMEAVAAMVKPSLARQRNQTGGGFCVPTMIRPQAQAAGLG
jgi:hypothetical protein